MRETNLTDRQKRWFASVVEGLERDTGKTFADWVAIARTCPETGHRARLKWFKDQHGLLQNRASQVLNAAFPPAMDWDDPDALIAALWVDPAHRAIFEAVDLEATRLPGVIRTARKGYTAWSRQVQFAALRPLKSGGAVLGLAVAPDVMVGLRDRGSQSWSERLTARIALSTPSDLTPALLQAISAAHQGA